MIGADGKNIGVMPRDAALALVRPEEGLDLIEIAPAARPPVARLISFDKWRYEEEKRRKKERIAQKGAGIKQIQISARAAENDLMVKIRKLEEFLAGGHPVEIQMRLRGREKYNKDWARKKLDDFLRMITVPYKIASAPKFGGRGMLAQITKQ